MKDKPKITFWQGAWWCNYETAQGCGVTPKLAWMDMRRNATFFACQPSYAHRIRTRP